MTNKNIILIFIGILLLGSVIYFVAIPKYRKHKLANLIFDISKAGNGPSITVNEIKSGLDKLTNAEVKQLYNFTNNLISSDFNSLSNSDSLIIQGILDKTGLSIFKS